MPPGPDALALAEALEQAYRLALAVEALAAGPTVPEGQAISVMVTELLGVLDQARASMLRPSTRSRIG
jgi:hypothetical protein